MYSRVTYWLSPRRLSTRPQDDGNTEVYCSVTGATVATFLDRNGRGQALADALVALSNFDASDQELSDCVTVLQIALGGG